MTEPKAAVHGRFGPAFRPFLKPRRNSPYMQGNRWVMVSLASVAAASVCYILTIDRPHPERRITDSAHAKEEQPNQQPAKDTAPTQLPDWQHQARALINGNLPPAEREAQLRALLEAWTSQDPSAAATFALTLASEQERIFGLHIVLRQWVLQDTQPALIWMQRLPAGKIRESAFDQVGRAIAPLDPATALSLSLEITEGAVQREYVSAVARGWASNRPEEASRWAQEIREDGMREQVSTAVAIEWAQRYPEAAADFVSTAFAPGDAQASAANTVAIRWAVIDPERAAHWAEQFPDDTLRRTVLHNVVSRWMAQDRDAVERWADALDPGPWRAEALAAVAELCQKNR